jgi:NAD(P)-dependent dehydrogenase (short-subunit alcohol dehydrogenase family)
MARAHFALSRDQEIQLVTAPRHCLPLQAAFRSMAKTRRGHICLVSSMAGLLGTFGFSAYSPTKFAIRGLGEVLVFEGRPYNISML